MCSSQGSASFKKLLFVFERSAKGKAETVQHRSSALWCPICSTPFGVHSSLFPQLFAKELFGKSLCLERNASSKTSKHLDLNDLRACQFCPYKLFTTFCGTRACTVLIRVTGERSQWTVKSRALKGNLCNPIRCLFRGKFPWEVTGDLIRVECLVDTWHIKAAFIKMKLNKWDEWRFSPPKALLPFFVGQTCKYAPLIHMQICYFNTYANMLL